MSANFQPENDQPENFQPENDQPENESIESGPSLGEQLRAWATEGNIDELWNLLLNTSTTFFNLNDVNCLLHQAIEQRALDAPDEFDDAMHRKMTSFTAYLVYRAHWLMTKQLRGHDKAEAQFRNGPSFCAEVLAAMPHLIELQNHLVALEQGHAATRRVRELTRTTRRGNEVKETAKRQPPRKGRGASSPAPGPVLPVNRFADLMDNLTEAHAEEHSVN